MRETPNGRHQTSKSGSKELSCFTPRMPRLCLCSMVRPIFCNDLGRVRFSGEAPQLLSTTLAEGFLGGAVTASQEVVVKESTVSNGNCSSTELSHGGSVT